MFFTQAALAVLALVAGSNAHMVITSPVPYGKSSLTNSPLDASGSDFPCKQRPGVYDITSMNNMAVGTDQTLAFMGGATHGGGSCQVSVTMDKAPTSQSQWKVIYSIVGGCPSSAAGNAASSADNTADLNSFKYQIPKGMPNGQYTLAWTWFNKIGNREMYMNCAPITVTGGVDNDLTVFNSLPDMFVVNLPPTQCSNTEGQDMVFPNPGKAVTTMPGAAAGTGITGSNCPAVTAKGKGSGSAAAPAAATGSGAASGTATPSAASSAAASAPAQSSAAATSAAASVPANSGGNFAQQSPTATSLTTVVVTTMAPSPVNSAATPAGTGGAGAVACPTDGSIVCIGANQWGLCDHGFAVPQGLAAGTTCTNNAIVAKKRSIVHRAHRYHKFSV